MLGAWEASDQTRHRQGVWIETSQGAVELVVWAEPASAAWRAGDAGTLFSEPVQRHAVRMARGLPADVPTIPDFSHAVVNLRFYIPRALVASTTALFEDELAERRQLPFGIQRRGLWTFEIRASDLERADRLERLLSSLGASDEQPAYFFLVVESREVTPRYYPFRVRSEQ